MAKLNFVDLAAQEALIIINVALHFLVKTMMHYFFIEIKK